MDDSCVVCAESLEWVAYGACGHKDVCSTCVARLRFICNDRRCCICKTETDVVFVTKALGDYTKTISDFSLLPSERKEGRVGQYFYHEDTQAFFDDLDHYKMIKAMCRLSCSVCDKMEDQAEDGSRRRARFRNIDQLKGHLFHKHKLLMCSLCLEGRKVFICEQKLYTRSQLTQHINTGDSEVDGTESERGGFSGHPMCEFCHSPLYGDNELYTHMSTEHYTCHICQRQHPGHYDYFSNYDDLEIHFRRDHFLCEDEGCLAKKFTVFQSEAELKRHNALEHGGHMSRSQRNVALQIPTSFRYRRNEQENRRGRGRTFHRDNQDNELSFAIQASLETASATPSSSQALTDYRESTDVESLIPPMESIATTEPDLPSRYRQALSQSSMSGTLGDSSFPPLAGGPGSNQQISQTDALSRKTMAACLRHQSNKEVKSSSSGSAWPAVSRSPAQPVVNRQTNNKANSSSSALAWPAASSTPAQPAISRTPAQPVIASHGWPSINNVSGSASSSGQSRVVPDNGTISSSHSTAASFVGSLMSSKASGSTNRLSHSSSAPSLSECESFEASSTDFPPVSAAQTRKSTTNDTVLAKPEDVHTANKSLVEKMRAALGSDEDKFTAFKDISAEYRQGLTDVETYLSYIDQFGLSHLVLDLARLLPNVEKQRELIEAHNLHMTYNASRENDWSNGVKDGNNPKKGEGKSVDSSNSSRKKTLADKVISTVRELRSSYKASEEDVEVLSKDGYRSAGGKSKVTVSDLNVESTRPAEYTKPENFMESLSASSGANLNPGNGSGKGKQRQKTSKFHRVRLGDGSIGALLDLRNGEPEPDSDPGEASSNGKENPSGGVPVRGVWRNSGGQKLFR